MLAFFVATLGVRADEVLSIIILNTVIVYVLIMVALTVIPATLRVLATVVLRSGAASHVHAGNTSCERLAN